MTAFALDLTTDKGKIFAPSKLESFGELVTTLSQLFVLGAAILFLAIFIWGGLVILTSGGDKEHYQKGKKMLTYAALGLVIVIAAYTIVKLLSFVFDIQTPL